MIKILHIVTRVEESGVSRFLNNYYENMDHDQVVFEIVAIETPHKQSYGEIFESIGMQVHYMPNHLLRRFLFLFSLIKSKKYDIVHCHVELLSSFYLTVAALAGSRIRAVHTHSINQIEGLKKRVLQFWLNKISNLKLGSSKKAISNLFGKKYEEKASVVYNAINVEEFSFNESIRIECRRKLGVEEKFVIGFVGRFSYLKNIPFVIDVFQAFQRKHPNTILMFAGSGELDEQIKEIIELEGLKDCTLFLGSRPNVNHLMMAMDVLLLLSLSEGLGIVLIEAQTAALKCITSKGRVPMETNISAYIHYEDIAESPAKWAELIEKECFSYSRKAINEEVRNNHFDIKRESVKLFELYQNALNRK